MLMVLSPAKKLDFDSPLRTTLHSQPVFTKQSRELVERLQAYDAAGLARLMGLSPALAELNVARYAQWAARADAHHARPAVLAFNGDVYEGLQAPQLSDAQLEWAQDHLAILSGLYGVLRPLDRIQPHRLEMGTRLPNPHGDTLYAYWGDQIARELGRRLDKLGGKAVLLNLASQEYFKSVDRAALSATVIECVFQDQSKGAWKIISFHAKRARGLMARHVIDHRIQDVQGLKDFSSGGYRYHEPSSAPDRLVFRRPAQPG